MKPNARICAILALLTCATANAQDNADAWSDEAIWGTVRETYGFEQKLRTKIFSTQEVRDQIARTGVVPACRVIAEFVDLEADAARDAYRSAIIAQVRTVVPDGRTFHERVSVSPSGHRFGRLLDGVARRAPELFVGLSADIDTQLVPELAAMPVIEGEWRGLFEDWNFYGANQSVWANACTISNSGDPAKIKVVFDGFYKERTSK